MVFVPDAVIVHPLVLLSIVDHYNRVAKGTRNRVVGVLLGEVVKGRVDVTNSFAVPFEEDLKDPSIWFFDHVYTDTVYKMFKRVNARERIVGWYSTGPKLKENDVQINEILRRMCPSPVLVICDVKPKELGLPVDSYVAVEEVVGAETRMTFRNVPSEIGAQEVEEVGVEHLLRDIKDTRISTLTGEVVGKAHSLRGLSEHIGQIDAYLGAVLDGKLPPNEGIMSALQDMFNLMPNLKDVNLSRALAEKSNDMMLSLYIASTVRGVLALHDLINNKIANKEHEAKIAAKLELERKQLEEAREKDEDGPPGVTAKEGF